MSDFAEADWSLAPDLMDGALNLGLTEQKCTLEYWIKAACQGTLKGLVNGHRPETKVPAHMLEDGPFRSAILEEFAYRSIAEELATRVLCDLVISAPTIETMEFYVTQVADEARHSSVFRGHLLELGVPREILFDEIERLAGWSRDSVLRPMEVLALDITRTRRDFIGGVILMTVMVEGVLAPAADLSEKKWRLINPVGAEIEKGANIDEIRHLTVGASIVRNHLLAQPGDKARILDLIIGGRRAWADLPADQVIISREKLFQEGMQQHPHLIEGYELFPGLLLSETTVDQRLELANEMSRKMQDSRLRYMGLEEAIDF